MKIQRVWKEVYNEPWWKSREKVVKKIGLVSQLLYESDSLSILNIFIDQLEKEIHIY